MIIPFSYEQQKIVTDGLVLNLDAGNILSYSGTGSTWYDLSNIGNNVSLVGSPTYNTTNLIFNGTNQIANTINTIDLTSTNVITFTFFMKVLNYITTGNSANIIFEFSPTSNSNINAFSLGISDNSNSSVFPGSTYPISLNNVGTVNGNSYNIQAYNKTLVNDLNWHYWTVIYNRNIQGTRPSQNILYIDNNLTTPTILPINPYMTNNTQNFGNYRLYFGGRNNSSLYSNIQLGNIQLYNRLLTSQEISQNFNTLRGRYGI